MAVCFLISCMLWQNRNFCIIWQNHDMLTQQLRICCVKRSDWINTRFLKYAQNTAQQCWRDNLCHLCTLPAWTANSLPWDWMILEIIQKLTTWKFMTLIWWLFENPDSLYMELFAFQLVVPVMVFLAEQCWYASTQLYLSLEIFLFPVCLSLPSFSFPLMLTTRAW